MRSFTQQLRRWLGLAPSRLRKPIAVRRCRLGLEGLETRINPVQSIVNGQGALSGLAYIDSNSNQIQDANELGLPGVRMTLTGTADDQSVISLTATTSSTGAYTFAQLKPGNYALQATINNAFLPGNLQTGTNGGLANNGAIQNIRVESGQIAFNYRFAVRGLAPTALSLRQFLASSTTANSIPLSSPGNGLANGTATALAAPVEPFTAPTVTLSSLAGSVFNDADGNRLRSGNEGGIAGATVFLSGTDDTGRAVFQTLFSSATGAFRFANLRPGIYTITLGQAQDGFRATGPALGTAGGELDGNLQIINIDLKANTNAADYLFGQMGRAALTGAFAAELVNDTSSPLGSATDRITEDSTIQGRLNFGTSIQTFRAGFDGMPLANYTDIRSRLQTSGQFYLSESLLDLIAGGNLSDGSHVLHLIAVDSAGQTYTHDFAFTYDTTGPAAPTLTVSAANILNGDAQRTTLAATDLVGSTTPGAFVQLFSNNVVIGTVTANNLGNYTFANIALTSGVNNFLVRSQDAAGNASNLDTFIVRNQGPTVGTAIVDVTVPANTTPAVIDLMANFIDADFSNSVVRFNTNVGAVDIELFDALTPQTVRNFLNYIEDGDYNDVIFHRLAYNAASGSTPRNPFVLQGGGYKFNDAANTFTHIPTDPTVKNEFSNTRPNTFGTVAMAKLGGNPDSASSEFFFNLNLNTGTSPNGLDFQNGGFTVFGKVQSGVDQQVVNTMAAFPISNQSSTLSALNEMPLRDFTGTFPADVDRNDLAIVNSTEIIRQTEELTFTIVTNTNPAVAMPTIDRNRLSLNIQAGASSGDVTDITIRATDRGGQFTEDTFRITMS